MVSLVSVLMPPTWKARDTNVIKSQSHSLKIFRYLQKKEEKESKEKNKIIDPYFL